MAYVKHTWVPDEPVTYTKLNNIESGVELNDIRSAVNKKAVLSLEANVLKLLFLNDVEKVLLASDLTQAVYDTFEDATKIDAGNSTVIYDSTNKRVLGKGAEVGDDSSSGSYDGSIYYMQVTALKSFSCTAVSINLDVGTNGNIRGALYDDSGDAPNNLLSESGSTATVAGRYDCTLGVAHDVVKGTKYWIAFQVSSGVDKVFRKLGGATLAKYEVQGYGAFPATATPLAGSNPPNVVLGAYTTGVLQSIALATPIDDIVKAIIMGYDGANMSAIQLTADGGVHWEGAVIDAEHTFTDAGKDLRVKCVVNGDLDDYGVVYKHAGD